VMQTAISDKVKPQHLARTAVVYLRQSSPKQVRNNTESQRLQYALRETAREHGWKKVETIDIDLGASASIGAAKRLGFDRLVGSVARGEVGIVLNRELSRLVRTDKDWCQLMEVCQVFDTLVGDGERVYDLNQADDQLVLGIKATISVAELRVLRMRLVEGMRAKASRGEFARQLPPGYVHDADDRVVKDPDRRVCEAMDLVFRRFRELWSVRQTFMWFHDQDIELPVNKSVGGSLRIVWQRPTHAFITDVLRNPVYAGAYVFGRRPVETVLIDGRLVRRQVGRALPAERCSVFIRDHHEGYISWDTYEENMKRIRGNAHFGQSDETVASVRTGQGLLAGVLRCGRCGRRLHVRYWGKSGTSARYLCRGEYSGGANRYCIGFGGGAVDKRIAEELLRVLSPLGMRASLAALDQIENVADERQGVLQTQLQQFEYEAQRAFEQYDQMDPRNRLVAGELERRWNERLEQVEKVKSMLAALNRPPPLGDEEREAIFALGEHFDCVWNSDRCPVELKKKIVRTVIEEIIVDLDDSRCMLSFVIHWKGGVHTRLEMKKPVGAAGQRTAEEDLDIIRRMAVRYGDDDIAYVLNKHGRSTGKDKRWTQISVRTARRNHAIAGQRKAKPDPELLTQGQAAKHAGVSSGTIKKLVASGVLHMKQIVPWAPWEIQRADLESEPVKSILEHLRRTGKLVFEGVDSDRQTRLF
jgi:DNA invertase Pin-like site-specific DNA recombinase